MEADILKHILDGREKPTNLPFSLLKNITEHFSENRVIGQGGFATVYKGVLPNGRVAVKRIRNEHSIDEKLFYGEVDSLLTVDHPNVVQFLGFCASTEQTAIKLKGSRRHIYAEIRERLLCFEYMSNGSLQKYITDELRGLEWNTRYQIIKGICEGLHHLHKEKHIYHMDLKPANILLDNHMMPKITDFGLARLDEKSQTMAEDRRGSLGYCAPEYLRSGKMSFKSDMFSLGVIITELVTGHKGIPDNNKNNVLRRWMHRWKKSGKGTPLIYQQVAKCMEVGLICQEIDSSKRPFIWDLIHVIRDLEGVNGEISNAYEYTFGQISPYSEDDMLGVDPIVLHFPFELNKQSSCSLQLTNHTDAYIAFNILNMSPLPYRTQPNKDIVPPRSKCSVDIILQAQDKAPRDMRHDDEFIIWSTKVDDGLAADDITTNMFSKDSGVVDAINLDVVFDAEGSTKVNHDLAAEDITTNMFNKETCTTIKKKETRMVDKMSGIVQPNLYPVRETSPQPARALPSPVRSTPRKTLAKHIKTTHEKRLGREKPKEGTKPKVGVVAAGASGNGVVAKMSLGKPFRFGKNIGATDEPRKKVQRGLTTEVYSTVVKKREYQGQTVAVKMISKAKHFKDGKNKFAWHDLASKRGQLDTYFPIIPHTRRQSLSTETCSSVSSRTNSNKSKMFSSAEGAASSGYSYMASSITATAAQTTHPSESSSSCRTEEIDFLRELLNACSLCGHCFERSGGPAILDQGLLKELNSNARLEEEGGRMNWRLLFDCANEVLSAKCAYHFNAGYGSWFKGMAKLQKLSPEEMHGEMNCGLKMAWSLDELVCREMAAPQDHWSWVELSAESFETGRDIAAALLQALLDEVVTYLVRAPLGSASASREKQGLLPRQRRQQNR